MTRRRMSFGRTVKDQPIKRATRRGRGPGRTQQTRVDDMKTVQDARKPQGVTSPIKDAAKATVPPTTSSVAAPERTPTNVTKGATAPTPTPKVPVVANKPELTEKPKVTGAGGRNVSREGPSGTRTRANVTKEQLQKTGLSLRAYLNFMDEKNRRPRSKADSEAAKKLTAAFDAKKAKKTSEKTKDTPRANMTLARKTGTTPKKMMGGGMMKSKMGTKGGAKGGPRKFNTGDQVKAVKKGPRISPSKKDPMSSPKREAAEKRTQRRTGSKPRFPDLNKDGEVTQADILMGRGVVKKKAGGMMKSKMGTKGGAKGGPRGYSKGGMKKGPKGYAKGGMKSKMATKKKPTKQKVRGAGIARKGVRPAKMR